MTIHIAGYWKDKKTFEPLLWSFTREADGSLLLRRYEYGAADSGKTPSTYRFKAPQDPEKLQALIYNLLALTSLDKKNNNIRTKEVVSISISSY